MRSIIAFFVDRSLVVNVVTIGVCVAGALVATLLTRALIPAIDLPYLQVDAELPGATAVEVESTVTYRLEEALSGLRDLEKLTSTTRHGQSHLKLEFEPGTDLQKRLIEVRSRLDDINHLLPLELRRLRAGELTSEDGNARPIGFAITGVDPTRREHRDAIRLFEESLRRIPGVLGTSNSLPTRHLYVQFDPQRMARRGIRADLARDRIREFFEPHPVGELPVRDQRIAVELPSAFEDHDALRALPLQFNRAGMGTTLGDVARISYRLPKQTKRHLRNGVPSTSLTLHADTEADVITISEQAHEALAAFQKSAPQGMTADFSYDVSDIIEHELGTVTANGLWGVALVLLILTIFLGFRIGVVTAIGLPFCYLGILWVLYATGVSINAMSLVAMILVVGILVDDAIIVAEEYCQLRQAGLDGREAAIQAVLAVGKPILGMMATTAIAFAPLLFLEGDLMWLLAPLPIVVIAALGLSLAESFFLLPNHLRHFIPAGKTPRRRPWLVWMTRKYQRILRAGLRYRYISLVLFLGLAGGAAAILMGPMRFDGNLSISGSCRVYVELVESTESLDALQEQVAKIEALVAELPADLIDRTAVTLGEAYTASGMVEGWKYAQLNIRPTGDLVAQDVRRRLIAEELTTMLQDFEDPAFERVHVYNDDSSQKRDVVSVYVSGGDRVAFHDIQDGLRNLVERIDGAEGIFWDDTRFQRGLYFEINSKAAARYGLTKGDVHRQIRHHFANVPLTRKRVRGEEVEVYAEFAELAKPNIEDLSALKLVTENGLAIPARYIGTWHEADTLRRIDHEDLLRSFKLDVLFDAEQTNAEEIAEKLEPKLEPLRAQFPGYHISVKPTEYEKEAKDYARTLLLVCLGLIYACLVFSLGSLITPLPVLIAIPFGFVGVVLAFYAHGLDLGLMAVIGLLGLAGVVVNDSLVMTSTIAEHRKGAPADASLYEVISEGASKRFSAVILTSLTTLAGVFPMAYGWSGETGWLRPMILAIGWGLLFATVLTLVLVPCLLVIFEDGVRVRGWLGRKLRLTGGSTSPTPNSELPANTNQETKRAA